MEVYQFAFLIAMFVCLWAWLYLLSRIGNDILLVLQEVNDRLPERELDGLGHGPDETAEDANEQRDGQRRDRHQVSGA